MKFRIAFILLTVFFVSGCATGLYEKDRNQAIKALTQAAAECSSRDLKGSKIKLQGKLYDLKGGVPTVPNPELDGFMPAADYSDVLNASLSEYGCLPKFMEWAEKHAKAAKPLVTQYFAEENEVFERLLGKNITYATAREQFRQVSKKFLMELNALEQKIEARNEADKKYYKELLIKAALTPSEPMQPMQPMQPMPSLPKQTTCIQSGNMTTCN